MNTALIAESFIASGSVGSATGQLVSIQRDPERAAAAGGSRGSIQLRYHSLQLVPVDLIDEVPGIWAALLDVVESFLAEGTGQGRYPGLDAEIVLQTTGGIAKFTAGKVRHIVDTGELIDAILDGAAAYHHFAGTCQPRIAELRSQVSAAGISAQGERAAHPWAPRRNLGE